MSKPYVDYRADLANLAAINAAQVATPQYVNGSIVVSADGKAAVCTDKDHASTPFALVGTQT